MLTPQKLLLYIKSETGTLGRLLVLTANNFKFTSVCKLEEQLTYEYARWSYSTQISTLTLLGLHSLFMNSVTRTPPVSEIHSLGGSR